MHKLRASIWATATAIIVVTGSVVTTNMFNLSSASSAPSGFLWGIIGGLSSIYLYNRIFGRSIYKDLGLL